jgi:hypothetical protein
MSLWTADGGTTVLAPMPAPNGITDPAVVRFMEVVMDALKTKTAGQLANLLVRDGFIEVTQARKVNRWVAGTSAPDHHATVYLLQKAGLLKKQIFE